MACFYWPGLGLGLGVLVCAGHPKSALHPPFINRGPLHKNWYGLCWAFRTISKRALLCDCVRGLHSVIPESMNIYSMFGLGQSMTLSFKLLGCWTLLFWLWFMDRIFCPHAAYTSANLDDDIHSKAWQWHILHLYCYIKQGPGGCTVPGGGGVHCKVVSDQPVLGPQPLKLGQVFINSSMSSDHVLL